MDNATGNTEVFRPNRYCHVKNNRRSQSKVYATFAVITADIPAKIRVGEGVVIVWSKSRPTGFFDNGPHKDVVFESFVSQ